MRKRITEYLDIDLVREMWVCNRCGHDLVSARETYKAGCLAADRDPREVHPTRAPADAAYNYAPDPAWCRLVEFYCPHCATLVETEYLPPGHPITRDLEIDVAALKTRYLPE